MTRGLGNSVWMRMIATDQSASMGARRLGSSEMIFRRDLEPASCCGAIASGMKSVGIKFFALGQSFDETAAFSGRGGPGFRRNLRR